MTHLLLKRVHRDDTLEVMQKKRGLEKLISDKKLQIARIARLKKDLPLKLKALESIKVGLSSIKCSDSELTKEVKMMLASTIDHYIEHLNELDLAASAFATGNIYKNYKPRTEREVKEDQDNREASKLFQEAINDSKKKIGRV